MAISTYEAYDIYRNLYENTGLAWGVRFDKIGKSPDFLICYQTYHLL